MQEQLLSHLETGVTTLARAWAVTRGDGEVLGFTDHDVDLAFDGVVFRADSGLTASALQQSTGLSVDNAEAMGVLRDARLSEADIEAGRFDGAHVRIWLVNWASPAQRALRFSGTLGEIRRGDGAFHAELRGLAEGLNRPLGRVYQKPCSAVLGDARCRVDLTTPGLSAEVAITEVAARDRLRLPVLPGFAPGWFQRGQLEVLQGAAAGLSAPIKRDASHDGPPGGPPGGYREVTLWTTLRAPLAPGDLVRLVAGCDKRLDTCRFKFGNILNFQGFPDIPSEDWLMSGPANAADLGGGSRR